MGNLLNIDTNSSGLNKEHQVQIWTVYLLRLQFLI